MIWRLKAWDHPYLSLKAKYDEIPITSWTNLWTSIRMSNLQCSMRYTPRMHIYNDSNAALSFTRSLSQTIGHSALGKSSISTNSTYSLAPSI